MSHYDKFRMYTDTTPEWEKKKRMKEALIEEWKAAEEKHAPSAKSLVDLLEEPLMTEEDAEEFIQDLCKLRQEAALQQLVDDAQDMGLYDDSSLVDLLNSPSPWDVVNNPKHYTTHPSGVECIQVTEHMGFCLGNAIKYLWRSGEKGKQTEDLKKAIWYIEREIQRLEKE